MLTPDGSWAEVPLTGPARLTYGGLTDIWALVEDAHAWWLQRGQPGVDRFSLSTAPGNQWVWLDAPENSVALT